ncbi:MAG TPA: diguanylate cyclase [Gemmatimonadales bacterium]|jgi:diguanylate cyclase (GGDEF)-like protein
MLHAIWKGASLRTWIGFGMAIAILPLGASALAGYLVLDHGVIASFQDVAQRQREQIDPTQRLRLLLIGATTPLDDFMDEGDAAEPPAYRVKRGQIEATFAEVHEHLESTPELRTLVERARDDWTAADKLAGEALSVRRAPGDPRGAVLMDEFHGDINAAVDKLGAVYDGLATDLHHDHDDAMRDVERTEWLAVLAAIVSVIAVLVGVTIIGRVMSASVERLVSGAELFASGDRDHRIDISLPPELHRVAAEFNKMIGRIHESEGALTELARRDPLTHLLNRRAFDDELAERFARQQRFNEAFALLVLDLDHFKRVNDQHGHAAGDEVLRTATRALSAELRSFDPLFRIGGEEFAVILTGSDASSAQLAAERLRRAVAHHPVTVDGTAITVTVSIGMAIATAAAAPDTLIRAADAALYRAKADGRNQVVMSAPLDLQ